MVSFLEVREDGIYANGKQPVDMSVDTMVVLFGVTNGARFRQVARPAYAAFVKKGETEIVPLFPPVEPPARLISDNIEARIDRGVGMELGTHWNEDMEAEYQTKEQE
jgi:hypothetical protein